MGTHLRAVRTYTGYNNLADLTPCSFSWPQSCSQWFPCQHNTASMWWRSPTATPCPTPAHPTPYLAPTAVDTGTLEEVEPGTLLVRTLPQLGGGGLVICQKASDKDGRSNGMEVGDP